MNGFADTLAAQRRLFILRFLVEVGGEANDGVIVSAARKGGFHLAARAELEADLDHLVHRGAAREEWLGDLRVIRLTERGEDCAFGRVAVDGVAHEIWRRA